MYWLKRKLVLPRVNPSNVQKMLPSTVERVSGACGPKKCAMLRTALMPFV
jgi:hypothetical protein